MAAVQDSAAQVSAWAPLRRPVFRTLWLAQLGSNVGGWMQTVAAQWFLVQSGSGSPSPSPTPCPRGRRRPSSPPPIGSATAAAGPGRSPSLERSAESADRFREQFRVRSWSEFTASRTERWTGSDAEALATLVDAATDVQEEHYFPAPDADADADAAV